MAGGSRLTHQTYFDRTRFGNQFGDRFAFEVADIQHGHCQRSARAVMIQKDSHSIFTVEFTVWTQMLVIPRFAAIDAFRAAVRMLGARARAQGEFIVSGNPYLAGIPQDDLVTVGSEQFGGKGKGLVRFTAT